MSGDVVLTDAERAMGTLHIFANGEALIFTEQGVVELLADRLAAERERWEASVLWDFVGAMPAQGEAPDFIAVLCDAVLGARTPA